MSVDRGYLGRAPGDRDPPTLHRSMDDLTFQKTKGLELVRLLRVIYLLCTFICQHFLKTKKTSGFLNIPFIHTYIGG